MNGDEGLKAVEMAGSANMPLRLRALHSALDDCE